MWAAGGPLEQFGVDARADRLYRVVLRAGKMSTVELEVRLGWPADEVERALTPLIQLGLVARRDGTVVAVSPHLSLGRLVDREARRILDRERAIQHVRQSMADYAAEERGVTLDEAGVRSVEVHTGAEIGAVMDALVRGTTGEMLFLHPVEWLANPGWSKIDSLISAETAGGRPVRSIYPVEVLHHPETLEVVRDWAGLGEQVRLVASPPSRLAVFGDRAALVPVEWGRAPARRVVVRTSGLVQALRCLFDLLWQHGVPLPDAEAVDSSARDAREQVLRLLAAGAKDETIARQLGLSLRTVRRRVAELLDEMGATTRFQAGVEAARRRLL